MIKSKRQNNIKLTTLMIAMTAAARQAKPVKVNADGLRQIPCYLIDLQLYEFIDTFNVIETARHVGVNEML